MCGDPPNIIIGTAFGFTFMDFLINTGAIAWAGMLLTLGLFYLFFRKALTSSQPSQSVSTPNQYPEPREAITHPLLFAIQSAIFLLVIVLLVTHAQTGISVALIGVIAAVLTTLAAAKGAPHIIIRLDWRTLLFFIGLFISVGGLGMTGVLKMMADYISSVSGGESVSSNVDNPVVISFPFCDS